MAHAEDFPNTLRHLHALVYHGAHVDSVWTAATNPALSLHMGWRGYMVIGALLVLVIGFCLGAMVVRTAEAKEAEILSRERPADFTIRENNDWVERNLRG